MFSHADASAPGIKQARSLILAQSASSASSWPQGEIISSVRTARSTLKCVLRTLLQLRSLYIVHMHIAHNGIIPTSKRMHGMNQTEAAPFLISYVAYKTK